MKLRRRIYGESNINTPPPDSHFRTRKQATHKPLSSADGVEDVAVGLKLADNSVDVKARATNDSAAQEDVVNSETKSSTAAELEKVDPPSDLAVVEAKSKEEVKTVDPSSASHGGKDQAVINDQVIVASKIGDDEKSSKAKKNDNNSTTSSETTASSSSSSSSDRRSRREDGSNRNRHPRDRSRRRSGSQRSERGRRQRRSRSRSRSNSYERSRRRSDSRGRDRRSRYDYGYSYSRGSYDGTYARTDYPRYDNYYYYQPPSYNPPYNTGNNWQPAPEPATANNPTTESQSRLSTSASVTQPQAQVEETDTTATDAAFEIERQKYLKFSKHIKDLYNQSFVYDKRNPHCDDYLENQHIIYAKHCHDWRQLEFESQMYYYSICDVKPVVGEPKRRDDDGKSDKEDESSEVSVDGNGKKEDKSSEASADLDSKEVTDAGVKRAGFYTADSWNPPATYCHIQFDTEIANVRRALSLCDLPDNFHTILITVGGITTVEQFALMSPTMWESLAKLMSKQKTADGVQLIINNHNHRLLVALSLWARVKIVLGKKFSNFHSLSVEELKSIAQREICDTQSDDSAELAELTDI